jgi:hypothetical protein
MVIGSGYYLGIRIVEFYWEGLKHESEEAFTYILSAIIRSLITF